MLKQHFNYLFWIIFFSILAPNAWSQTDPVYCDSVYQWSSSINFSAGNVVRDKGIRYKAKRQTRAERPDTNSGANGSWQKLAACLTYVTPVCDFNGDGIMDLAKGFPGSSLISGK